MCQHNKSYLDICRHYRSIFDTPKVQAEEQAWKEVGEPEILHELILYTVLYTGIKEFSALCLTCTS